MDFGNTHDDLLGEARNKSPQPGSSSDPLTSSMEFKFEESTVTSMSAFEAQSMEEELMKELNEKHSELTNFLDQNSTSINESTSSDIFSNVSSSMNFETATTESNSVVGDIPSHDTYLYGKDFASEKKEAAGGDMKSFDNLADKYERASPNMMDFTFESLAQNAEQQRKNLFGSEESQDTFQGKPTPQIEIGEVRTSDSSNKYADDPFAYERESPQLPEVACKGPESPSTFKYGLYEELGMGKIEKKEEKGLGECPKAPNPSFDFQYSTEMKSSYEEEPSKNDDVFSQKSNESSLIGSIGGSETKSEKSDAQKEVDAPPVPKHGKDSEFMKARDVPRFEAQYGRGDLDAFEEDSLSFSNRLSDSLEVLKESPLNTKDFQGDEALLDMDEFSSSKSISPNGNKRIEEITPPEMVESSMFESGEFSSQYFGQAKEVKKVDLDKSSIEAKAASKLQDDEFFNKMSTSFMASNNTLENIQEPKFDESDEHSFKETSAQSDPIFVQPVAKPQEFKPFEEFLPKESFETIGSTYSSSALGDSDSESQCSIFVSKKEKEEKKKCPERTPPPPEIIKETPKSSKVEVKTTPKAPSASAYQHVEVSDEVERILNTFNPKAWFNPEKLHPTVSELVYWRDPKKSGVVFGSIFVVLISLSCLSLISVVSYVSLAVLSGTFAFKVYKSILQAIQKTQDGHPFKEYLDMDLALPTDKAQEISNAVISYFNCFAVQMRRLFLVEDMVDSAKFGLLLYFLTYLGAWFNGLTLLILAFVALFALPKVYETNKTVIDQYIDLVWGKISEIHAKVSAAIPFGNKEKAQ